MRSGLSVIRPTAIALLLLAGCGGGPTDEERVDAALLRLSDFPPDQGWVVEPTATDDPAQAEFDAALDECERETDPTVGERSADRDSDSFAQGTVIVASNAAVVANEEVRDELFGALDSMLGCFGTVLKDALIAQGGEDASVDISDPYALDVSTAANRTVGRAIQLSADTATLAIDTVYVDFVAIEQGPTLLFGAFMHQGELTLDDEEEILAPAVARLKEL